MHLGFWNPSNNKKFFSSRTSSINRAPRSRKVFRKIKLNPRAKKTLSIILGVFALLGVLGYLIVGRPLIRLVGYGKNLKADITVIRTGFVNRDLIEIRQGVDNAETNLASIENSLENDFKLLGRLPFVDYYYQDAGKFLTAGKHVLSSVRELADLVEPFADAMGLRVSEEQEIVALNLIEAISSWVAIMPEIAEDTDGLIGELSLAGDSLNGVDFNKYPEKVGKYEIRANMLLIQSVLTSLRKAAPDIKNALLTIPRLVGADGTELRYMIIMQNDKELRPTGGFWTNYATFKVRNATLNSDFSSYDMYSIDFILDAIDSYYTFPQPPAAYTTYLKVPRLYARDTNYSPDFPTSLENFNLYYDMAMQIAPGQIKPVDGFIAIDTQVLEELLEITGPVTVGGLTYTSENVVLELEKIASLTLKEQAGRKDVLGYLMQAMLINVFESKSNLWSPLIEKGIDLSARKHILYFMYDQEAQAMIEEYGIGGRIADPVEGDYAYVVSTNLGGDKTNWFVDKVVTHKLEKSEDRWVRTVSMDYTYNMPESSYGAFATRYQDWVRLYVPEGSELIESTGFDQKLTGGGPERGKDYFDGFLGMAPGEKRTVSFKYYLPDGIIDLDNGKYSLLIQKQPGIDVETHIINLPDYTRTVELDKDFEVEVKL